MKSPNSDLQKVYSNVRQKVKSKEMSQVTALEICLKHIRAAGCKPNSKFYKALRAARELDRICSLPPGPPPEGVSYRILGANGRYFNVFVPKGQSIFDVAREENIEMISFEKA